MKTRPAERPGIGGSISGLVYCFSSRVSPLADEASIGLEEVPGLLRQIRQWGISVEEIDLSARGDEDRKALYEQACAAANRSGCAIRRIFGSRRRGYGPFFGREAPALLVYRGKRPVPDEVYPCYREGRVMTIRDFLKGLPEEERSLEPIAGEDLARLAEIAREALGDLIQRKPRWAPYRDRLLAIALCQGAACHYRDRRTGVKDFDVWLFFAEIPGQRFPYRWRACWDFGPSRFGRTPGFWGVGRRVDILGRSLRVPQDADPAETIREYLQKGKGESPKKLREKAVILLYPPERLGEVVWEGACGADESPAGLVS